MTVLWPLIAILVASQEPVASLPDFSPSKATVLPAEPRAGDVIHYEITVTNTGGPAGTSSVTSELPRAYLIDFSKDCASARLDPATRHAVWYEGPFKTGESRTCAIRMLSRRTAAGTQANVDTAIAAFRPETYWRFSAEAEVGSVEDPTRMRVGSFYVSRAGVAVVGLIGIFLVGIPVIAVIAGSGRMSTMAVRAWGVIVVCLGFLFMFGALGYDDYRAATVFKEARCTIFDQDSTFALRYTALGAETFSSGFGTATRLGFGKKRQASGVDAFSIGSTHPCWYDPADVKTVLLDRSPGGAYVFALIPLVTLLYAATMLRIALGRT